MIEIKEKPFNLLTASLKVRKDLRLSGYNSNLRQIATEFIRFYQDGNPPPVTRYLNHFVYRRLKETIPLPQPPETILD